MEALIIIVLIAITAIFITLYFFQRINIGRTIKQLDSINSSKTNSKILLFTVDKHIEKLALAINKGLEEKINTEAQYKKMELELRQAIANMSHDLRTPLTSIMGYIQLLEDNSITEDEKKQYIDIIKRRSKSLQMLVSSFYDLSRLEAKEYKFDIKQVNLAAIMCDILASFYNDFLNKEIEPEVYIDEKASSAIADEGAVRRIISNLIQNILKYGEQSVLISLQEDKGYIVTVFKNFAPNLTEEDVARLFERFFTVDRMRTDKSTGLGLAITKQLVEQMGHLISATLEEGFLTIEIRWKASANLVIS